MKSLNLKFNTALTGFALVASLSATADDRVAKAKYEEAKTAFANRADAAQVENALAILTAAEKEATDSELKYDVLLLASRTYFWKGMHTTAKKARAATFEAGRVKAEEAIAINSKFADAHYYEVANRLRWGQTVGAFEAGTGNIKKAFKGLEVTMSLKTKDGQPGATFEGYGPHRSLGNLYAKAPSLLGGSTSEGVKNLEIAAVKAPEVALNVVDYADVVITNGVSKHKAKAKQMLIDLLKNDPNTLNPNRVPETIEEFAQAKKVLAQYK